MKDTLYRSAAPIAPFEFNKKVADVFPDMIERSVPGYALTLSMISVLADEFVQAGSNVYDLGCSLGAVSLAVLQGLGGKQCTVIAVDNSPAMIDACRDNFSAEVLAGTPARMEFFLEDIARTKIVDASVVVMNFTLQFIRVQQRLTLLKNIYRGLLPGGILVLSEKVVFEEDAENRMMLKLHQRMKALNGYQQLEIAGKRQALEDVLIAETLDTHKSRLQDAGFDNIFVYLKCFNFVSLLAVKRRRC